MYKIKSLKLTVGTVKNNYKGTNIDFVSVHFHLRVESKKHHHTEHAVFDQHQQLFYDVIAMVTQLQLPIFITFLDSTKLKIVWIKITTCFK